MHGDFGRIHMRLAMAVLRLFQRGDPRSHRLVSWSAAAIARPSPRTSTASLAAAGYRDQGMRQEIPTAAMAEPPRTAPRGRAEADDKKVSMLIDFRSGCASAIPRRIAQALVLILGLATGLPSFADATAPAAAAFALDHAAEVDSGLLSVLGSFSSTRTSTAPTLHLPMFDPSLGHLDSVAVSVNTTASSFVVSPNGLLGLVSFASASRTLGYTITAGATTASDGTTRVDSGATLLTLLGLGTADIGGAQLAKTTTFTAPAELANFTGAGDVAVALSATDTLGVSTLLSLVNGAGFSGCGRYTGTVSLTYRYTPYAGSAQLSISKAASVSSAKSGDTITYTLVFTNNGASPISTLVIDDATPAYTTFLSATVATLPAGIAVAAVDAPVAGATGALVWTFAGQLAAQASGTVQYTVVVD